MVNPSPGARHLLEEGPFNKVAVANNILPRRETYGMTGEEIQFYNFQLTGVRLESAP